jgi:hypothetical protein
LERIFLGAKQTWFKIATTRRLHGVEHSEIQKLLMPVIEAMGDKGIRIVMQPGWCTLDTIDACQPLQIEWGKETHQEVLNLLSGSPITLDTGDLVRPIQAKIIITKAHSLHRKIQDLVQDGALSRLAADFLNESLNIGRNILVVGPWGSARYFAGHLVNSGMRPAILSDTSEAIPTRWPLFQRIEDLNLYGADRIGVWSTNPGSLRQAFGSCSSVVGWLDAQNTQRALIRFEALAPHDIPGPLKVLSALDLIVTLSATPQFRISQISEIRLAEDGYRPALLFNRGSAPSPTALVPIALPSFAAELQQTGNLVMLEDLTHAVGALPQTPPSSSSKKVHVPQPSSSKQPLQQSVVVRPSPVIESPTVPLSSIDDDAAPPGWELDQLAEEIDPSDEQSIPDNDSATLAATFGLGPPPRPVSMQNQSSDLLGTNNDAFAEALARAHQRDRAMQEELGEEAHVEIVAQSSDHSEE